MSVKMSYKGKPNNSMNETGALSEGLWPGRCPIGEQDGPGRHRTTEKKMVSGRECYNRSEYGRNGYRKSMHAIWNEMGMFSVTK